MNSSFSLAMGSRSTFRISRVSSVEPIICAGLMLCLILCFAWSRPVSAHTTEYYKQERENFRSAMQQLALGQTKAFFETKSSLVDYPLYPYLEYELINSKLKRLPQKEVQTFLKKYEGEPVAKKMTRRWLNKLIKKHQWQKVVDHWDPSIKDARLKCWHLRATYRIGEKEKALSQVEDLWLKASSQPKACDPLFKEWIDEGYLTQDIAWQRLELAMNARRLRLASYIVRKLLIDDYKELGQAYLTAHRRPHKLPDFSGRKDLGQHDEKLRKIVAFGVERLARKNPEKAQAKWQSFSQQYAFSQDQISAVELAIKIHTATNRLDKVDLQDSDALNDAPSEAIEKALRIALREIDWQRVFYLIQNLPVADRSKNRWQYWLARSMEEQKLSIEGMPSPLEIYETLSKKRSYYGFLSADRVKSAYAMQDYPVTVTPDKEEQLKQNQKLVRALELYAVDQLNDARMEWRYGTRRLEPELLLVAGKYAEDFDWHEQAIRTYIEAQYWNDLQARFPLAYENKFVAASKEKQIETSWLFAIARQESAFSPDAKSHAGALGLMQVMPRTAKQTAREIGLKLKLNDLFKPETNIHIGSSYLKSLLDEFKGNRILATTAYNAGPHRVKGWLKKTKNNLPFDVWIETIPFRETRHYVQNVLAFSVIYDYRMGRSGQLVKSLESSQLL